MIAYCVDGYDSCSSVDENLESIVIKFNGIKTLR